MVKLRVIELALIAAILTVAPVVSACAAAKSEASPHRAPSTATVRVTEHVQRGAFAYGAIWHVTLAGPAAFRGSFGGRVREVEVRVPAGTTSLPGGLPEDGGLNRVESFETPCADERCSRLGRRTPKCSLEIRVRPGEKLEVEVHVKHDGSCVVKRARG